MVWKSKWMSSCFLSWQDYTAPAKHSANHDSACWALQCVHHVPSLQPVYISWARLKESENGVQVANEHTLHLKACHKLVQLIIICEFIGSWDEHIVFLFSVVEPQKEQIGHYFIRWCWRKTFTFERKKFILLHIIVFVRCFAHVDVVHLECWQDVVSPTWLALEIEKLVTC